MALSDIPGSDRVSSGTLGALNATVELPLSGFVGVGFSLFAGTITATITPEISLDGGTTWFAVPFFDPTNENKSMALTVTNPNSARALSLSIAGGATNARVRVTAYTSGSVTGALIATAALSQIGIQRKLVTHTAVYKLAARPYALSFAMGANSRKQFATIHHASSAQKIVKVRHVWVTIESGSANGIIAVELRRITSAPATGNPAITPAAMSGVDPAAEATCLALPTTVGTEGSLVGMTEWDLTKGPAASYPMPPPALAWIDILSPPAGGYEPDGEKKLPIIQAGVLEGYAVTMDVATAATVKGFVAIQFTEE